jgi:small-conductance mechanosensitive channel
MRGGFFWLLGLGNGFMGGMLATLKMRIGWLLRLARARLIRGVAYGALLTIPPLGGFAQGGSNAEGNAVLGHLNAVVDWYQNSQKDGAWVTQPEDTYFWNNQRTLADEVVKQAFAWAHADVDRIGSGPAQKTGTSMGSEVEQMNGFESGIADRLQLLQSELSALNRQITFSLPGANRSDLIAQRDALQAEVDLTQDLKIAAAKAAAIVLMPEESGGAATVSGQLEALERSVPAATGTAAASAPPSPLAEPSGLIQTTVFVITLTRDLHELDSLAAESEKLRIAADKLYLPVRTELGDIVQKGPLTTNQLRSSDPKQLESMKSAIQSLAANFGRLSGQALALRQESAALIQSHDNLIQWRASLDRRYGSMIRTLLVRGLTIVAVLAILLAVSEAWRRATIHYVHEVRRRRQFLLVRRFVTAGLVVVVVLLGFVSNFGSLATFAGLATAGIAFALNSVILSVAAYFSIIGRYGIRAGDRITLCGTSGAPSTGDVLYVGLVRIYMMELAPAGVDLHPTGRVVAFPNSVLFATVPMFRQIPGTAYAWHEISMSLAPDVDMRLVEKKILKAVEEVFAEYRPSLERQLGAMERMIDMRLDLPSPSVQVRLGDTGLELVVRFPVDLLRAAATDDAVLRGVTETLHGDVELKKAVSGSPKIRALRA